jgi:hypothetical protein
MTKTKLVMNMAEETRSGSYNNNKNLKTETMILESKAFRAKREAEDKPKAGVGHDEEAGRQSRRSGDVYERRKQGKKAEET